MKKVIVIGVLVVLIITLYIGCFTALAEKKVWGKQNKVANEIASSVQNLYINVLQVLEKGINEELGDPDVLGKFKDNISKKFNPELVPEKLEELESFVSSFIEEVMDFHKFIDEGKWADPLIIEELKSKIMELKPAIIRISPSKVAKFKTWGIDYPPRIVLGIEYNEVPLSNYMEQFCSSWNCSQLAEVYKKAAGSIQSAGLIVIKGVLPDSPLSKATLIDSDNYSHLVGEIISVAAPEFYRTWVLTHIDDQFIYSSKKLIEVLDVLKSGSHTFTFFSEENYYIGKVSAVIEETQFP